MQEQKPSIGRIVLFSAPEVEQEVPAIITRVWSNGCVNLAVFVDEATTIKRYTSVMFDNKGGWSWRWPPRV